MCLLLQAQAADGVTLSLSREAGRLWGGVGVRSPLAHRAKKQRFMEHVFAGSSQLSICEEIPCPFQKRWGWVSRRGCSSPAVGGEFTR